MDSDKKKMKSNNYGPKSIEKISSTSWLSHPNKLFQQPEKQKTNHSRLVDGCEKQNQVLTKTIPQSSTSIHDSDLVTSHIHITTPLNASMNNDNMMEQSSEENESNSYELKCLDVIQHLIVGLTTEDKIFCNIINKILDLTATEDPELKALKYDLFDILLVNLLESTSQELKSIEQEIKELVFPDSLNYLVVNSNSLEVCELLGGFSSVVHAGILSKDCVKKRVVVKKPSQNMFAERIMIEANVLSECDHKNIIKILGIVKKGPMIAIEMMEMGNLAQAIMQIRFSVKNLHKIFLDVATGMEYLQGKQYLHRNLTPLNVYINARKQCKIGNFGSCVYVGDSNGMYEEKELHKKNYMFWVSPETCSSNIFRYQTDVWAMGMLIWAVHVGSSDNVPHLHPLKYLELRDGTASLKKPERCPDDLFFFVVNHLLDRKYTHRPSFTVIRRKLEKYC